MKNNIFYFLLIIDFKNYPMVMYCLISKLKGIDYLECYPNNLVNALGIEHLK